MASVSKDKNIPGIHIAEWQFMTPLPVNTAAGSFVISDFTENGRYSMSVVSVASQYLYDHQKNGWMQLPSSGISGTFGAGSCGVFHPLAASASALVGSAKKTIKTNLTLYGTAVGKKIRIIAGTNAGEERTITAINTVAGASEITVDTNFSANIDATSVFQLFTGRFWFLNAGTGGLRYFDLAQMAWSAALSIANLPATIGTDGKLVATPSARTWDMPLAQGAASGGSSSTTLITAGTWTANQWTNYQVRIVSGLGAGQFRTISSNTINTLTVSAAWTTTPDATSNYVIEGNDDFLYFLGNNTVNLYKYVVSTNTWSLLSPSPVRAVAPGLGMSANWVARVNDPNWKNEANIQNGRYIFSFQGGATANLHRYDLALNRWDTIVYGGATETFTTGSSYDQAGNFYYIGKDSTNRFFVYDFAGQCLLPFTTHLIASGAAVIGDKLWVKSVISGGIRIEWMHILFNTSNLHYRIMIIQ